MPVELAACDNGAEVPGPGPVATACSTPPHLVQPPLFSNLQLLSSLALLVLHVGGQLNAAVNGSHNRQSWGDGLQQRQVSDSIETSSSWPLPIC